MANIKLEVIVNGEKTTGSVIETSDDVFAGDDNHLWINHTIYPLTPINSKKEINQLTEEIKSMKQMLEDILFRMK